MDTGAKKQADTYSNSYGLAHLCRYFFDIIVYMICYFFDNDGMHYNNTMDYITAIIIVIKKSVSSYHRPSLSF